MKDIILPVIAIAIALITKIVCYFADITLPDWAVRTLGLLLIVGSALLAYIVVKRMKAK